ncbi:MAG TPA: SpoIIE family protein phosphatase [Blastococcus sp.]|nr:SpoIIE family protein phosphatase [Blastococcus sp.]
MTKALWAPQPPPDGSSGRLVGRWRPARPADLTAGRLELSAALQDGARSDGAGEEAVDRLTMAFEELASNAIRHGRGPVEITVTTLADGGWLLTVCDAAGEVPPVPAVGRDAALGGLGLHMTAEAADAHGWTPTPDGGKAVWVRIDVDRTRHRPTDLPALPQPRSEVTVVPPVKGRDAPPRTGGPMQSPILGEPVRTTSEARPHRLAFLTAAAVLALTAVLTVAAWQTNRHTNQVLLQRQVSQAAAVLTTQVAVLESQLADAGQVADATGGAPGPFQRFAAARATPGMSYSLWRITGGQAEQLAVQGPAPQLPPGGGTAFLTRVQPTGKLTVAGILPGGDRLGYALMPAGETNGLVVYVESPLPPRRHVDVRPGAAFSGLDFAVYLGSDTGRAQLIEATGPTPIPGAASTRVPFGDTALTVEGASPTPLTGGLSAALPWLVLGVGALIAVGGGVLVDVITRRRGVAERLAQTTQQLYQQQRGIAADLQRALLPAVPDIDGLQVAARYRAGEESLEVGGDWFDVIEVRPGRVVFVVGDVSGHGLPAATTMAALRYAARGFLSEGHPIDGVLPRLRGLLDVATDHQFATVLLGELDVSNGRLRLLSAGHFPPLLVSDGETRTLHCPISPPVGVDTVLPPDPVTVTIPAGATLLAFSDGLVERRGEELDAGLDRLTAAARGDARPLGPTLDHLLDELAGTGVKDDTVLLGLRWTGVPARTPA